MDSDKIGQNLLAEVHYQIARNPDAEDWLYKRRDLEAWHADGIHVARGHMVHRILGIPNDKAWVV